MSTCSSDRGDESVKIYKRSTQKRVFVNRSLHLEKINHFGFDMDYTLAVYKSPQYEALGFNLVRERLISMGYPEAIKAFQYDPTFPIRGLWFDKHYGTLLKVDSYGNILTCVHGFNFMKPQDIRNLYPNKFLQLDESRIYVLNTLFNLPETYLLACLIDFFTNSKGYTKEETGVVCGELHISYRALFQDVRSAMDWVHIKGNLKKETVNNLEKYVHKDHNLSILLDRLRLHTKTFLLTNSDYSYTNKIMAYLLDFPDQRPETSNDQIALKTGNKYFITSREKRHWTSYFDYNVVDASKPLFFTEGTTLRQVDKETGALKLGVHTGPLRHHQIYSGGNCDEFSRLIGAKGKDVIYIGDHIFGDILKCKKTRGWRTFLVVPELSQELQVWTNEQDLRDEIEGYEADLSSRYRNLDSSAEEKPDITDVTKNLRQVAHKMDLKYGLFGSLFKTGTRQTFFGSQVERYSDLYASTFLNLLHYPLCYLFKAPSKLMPHESTVDSHEISMIAPAEETQFASRHRSDQFELHRHSIIGIDSLVPNPFAETPRHITHHFDEDVSSDEESPHSSAVSNKAAVINCH